MTDLDRIISSPSYRVQRSSGVRDPRAASQLLTYSSPGVRQIPEWNADSAIREAYLSSVIVYSCVQVRAKAIAGAPLRAVLPGKDVADFDPNAPLAKLLGPSPGSPNPTLSARRLWMNAVANYIVTGKFAWELEAPEGAILSSTSWAPVAIWPLIARVFDVLPTDGGSSLFAAFRYGRGDRKVILQPSQVFYSYNPSLNDMRQAASALQSMRYDILAEVMQSVYDAAFLRNDARPAGLIVQAAFGEPSQRRAYEQQWDATHRSPQNANRMAFAYTDSNDPDDAKGPIQYINMGLSQRDAQMLQTQQAKVNRICMGLGVPMSMLDASGRTFNNGGLEAQNFWTNTVLPDLADFEDEINRTLAPRLGPHVAKFDTRHIEALKPPSKFISISVGDAVDRGILDPDEARNEMGYDTRSPEQVAAAAALVGSAMAEQAALATGLAALAAASPELVPWMAQILGLPTPPAIEPPIQLPPTAITKVPETTWAQSFSVVREFHREAQQAAWEKALTSLLARQRKTTLDRLEGRKARWEKTGTRDASEIFDPIFQAQQTEEILAPLLEMSLRSEDAAGLAQMLTDATYAPIQDAVERGDLEGIEAAFAVPVSVRMLELNLSDPSERSLHADQVRSLLYAIADGSVTVSDLVA